jgi:hypothetical protein
VVEMRAQTQSCNTQAKVEECVCRREVGLLAFVRARACFMLQQMSTSAVRAYHACHSVTFLVPCCFWTISSWG